MKTVKHTTDCTDFLKNWGLNVNTLLIETVHTDKTLQTVIIEIDHAFLTTDDKKRVFNDVLASKLYASYPDDVITITHIMIALLSFEKTYKDHLKGLYGEHTALFTMLKTNGGREGLKEVVDAIGYLTRKWHTFLTLKPIVFTGFCEHPKVAVALAIEIDALATRDIFITPTIVRRLTQNLTEKHVTAKVARSILHH